MKNLVEGPDYEKGEPVFTAETIRDSIEKEFGVSYRTSSIYDILRRLKCRKIKARPKHPKNDPAVIENWLDKILPNRISQIMERCPDQKFEFWFQDECRFGEKASTKGEWKPQGYQWTQASTGGFRNAYIFGAACPATGKRVGYVTEGCNIRIS